MNAMTRDDLLKALTSKHGLNDKRLYVGRTEAHLTCAGLGTKSAKVAWVYGPKRIGKTAFSEELVRRFVVDYPDALIVTLDASTVRTFDELLSQLLSRAGDGGAGEPRTRFERFADATRDGRQTLLVVDELDRIALDFGLDEQGLLRTLTCDDRKLSYVFVSHTEPSRIVEEVPDEASRLLGIAQPVRIGILDRTEVTDLFGRVASTLGFPEVVAAAGPTWDTVGGHPISVMRVLQKVAIAAIGGERELHVVLDEVRDELLGHMRSLWDDLSPGTRAVLLDDGAMTDSRARGLAKSEGFVTRRDQVIRPSLLMEASKAAVRLGEIEFQGAEATATFRLHDLIYEINVNAKTRKLGEWFDNTDETRRQCLAARPCRTAEAFRAMVDHLSKAVYEAARQPDPNRTREGDPTCWRIRDPYRAAFSSSPGVKALRTYRNFFFHDPDFGKEEGDRSTRHEEVGKVFNRACGAPWPSTPELWSRAHGNLLSELVAAAQALLNEVCAVSA